MCPFSRANIYARDNHACQYCGHAFRARRADVRPRRAGRAGRPQGLGEHRHLLHHLQPAKGRTHAGAGRHAPHPLAAAARPGAGPAHHVRPAATRRKAGATTSTGTSSSTTRKALIVPAAVCCTFIRAGPFLAAALTVDGTHLPLARRRARRMCTVGGTSAQVRRPRPRSHSVRRPRRRPKAARSPFAIDPSGRRGRDARSRRGCSRPACTRSTAPRSIGLGRLYVTQSGGRGTKVPVPHLSDRCPTASASRSPWKSPIRRRSRSGRDGAMYVSSRFEGQVYRLTADDRVEVYATRARRADGAGVRAPTARCSSAIGRARSCACRRDRTVEHVRDAAGQRRRVSPGVRPGRMPVRRGADARVARSRSTASRPIGSWSRLRRLRPAAGAGVRRGRRPVRRRRARRRRRAFIASGCARPDPEPELVLTAPMLIGLAFDPAGGLVIASSDTLWRLDVPRSRCRCSSRTERAAVLSPGVYNWGATLPRRTFPLHGARLDCRPRRARPQPAQYRRRSAPRPAGGHHRSVRVGQVVAGLRHHLRRRASGATSSRSRPTRASSSSRWRSRTST